MQDALSIKLWGPLFDDFVDIQIFMILGGHVEDDDDDDDTRPVALGQGATRAQEKHVVRPLDPHLYIFLFLSVWPWADVCMCEVPVSI